MKRTLLPLAVAALATAAQAQTSVTVSTSPGNADQVWYSLQNGEQGRAALAEWDLAWEVNGLTAGIRVNTAKGILAFETAATFDQWDALNSVDSANWTRIENDPTKWEYGAINHGNNMDLPDGLNVGWGTYSMQNHAMTGSKVFALNLSEGIWKKLRINSVISGVCSFTYANLDGSDEQNATMNRTLFAGKNFAYWSFSTNASLNREPVNTDWDLLFTKYTDFAPTAYNPAGVLQNKNVAALQVDGVPTADAQWTSAPFSPDINTLGFDWKTYDFDQGQYTIVADRTYFVADRAGNIWKLIFTGYGGGATGDISFTQELVSSVGVAETAAKQGTLAVWPNPATNGQVQLLLDVPAQAGVLRAYNATGQQVMQQALSGLTGLSARTLEVGQLAPGIYTLRFEAAGTVVNTKLVME